jgi:hypothetical protein
VSRSEYVTIPRAELEQLIEAARAWAEFNLEDEDLSHVDATTMTEIVELCDLWEA